MSSTTDGLNHLQKAFKDVETLRREEWKRRRLLRFEQVRLQSKDIANLVRQKVQSEREKQLGLVEERVNAKTQQWQVRKLKALQNEYENSLQNVGKGHTEAARLPNEEELRKKETEKIQAAAHKRGQEALSRLREEEALRRKADEERRAQLNQVRAIEEARSAAVVALPLPESTAGIKSIPPKKSICVVAPPTKTSSDTTSSNVKKTNTVPEWSKRPWPQPSLPLGVLQSGHEHLEQGDTVRLQNKTSTIDSAAKQHLQVSSHGDFSGGSMQPVSAPPSQMTRTSSDREVGASAVTSEVKFYDYTSCYQSQSDKISGIVEKVNMEGEINAKDAAEKEMSKETTQHKLEARFIEREQQRSRAALRRVQVQRDYKNLMGDLSLLVKQNAVFHGTSQSSVKSSFKSKNQEEQLKLAVENLIQDGEASNFDLDSSSAHTSDGSLVVSGLGETPGSVPKLNVGRYQPLANPSEEVSYPKEDISPTESIVLAPATCTPHSVLDDRQQHYERDAALRNLVQRINIERHSLLHSNQQSTTREDDVEENEKEVKRLEEKLILQRQQLEAQRSEVKRLDASIVLPDLAIQSHGEPMDITSTSSTLTHESIIIEPSHSEESQDLTGSILPHSQKTLSERKAVIGKSIKLNKDSSCHSPGKENKMYSMDVSLSSVFMDQTENSSSGSKSLSLHGVQVLVKVCGAEEDSSDSRLSSFSKNDQGVKITELSSTTDSSGFIKEDKKRPTESTARRTDGSCKAKSVKEKVKTKHDIDFFSRKMQKQSSKKPTNVKKADTASDNLSGQRRKVKSSITVDQLRKVADGKKNNKRDSSEPKVEVSQEKQKKVASDKKNHEQPASTSTSYLSPPDRVLSSLTQDIKTLIALAQGNVHKQRGLHDVQQNPSLVRYINRLLAMSRESIDKLNVSCSEVSTPSSTLFHSYGSVNEVDANLSNTVLDQDQVIQLALTHQNHNGDTTDIHQSIDDDSYNQVNVHQRATDGGLLNPIPNDSGVLSAMTKQCHDKISALTKMIEEVRRQAVINSPTSYISEHSSNNQNQSSSPIPLDSTAYMSPPPQVLEWADILPPVGDERQENISLDPYGAAVRQLLAEVRSQLIPEATKPSEVPSTSFTQSFPQKVSVKQKEYSSPGHQRPRPPVAFWRNIERCNVVSPTEPHELSTIPELGTTLHESIASQPSAPSTPLRSPIQQSTPGTPPDVIAELLRRKLLTSPFAWAKKRDLTTAAAFKPYVSFDSNFSPVSSQESDLSSGKTGTGLSDVSASKETNTMSLQSQNSSSNGSNGLKGWKKNHTTSPADTSADEVEGDFRRMGIGWVGAMLRKTKEAGALSSTSSSDSSPFKMDKNDFKNLIATTDDEPILSSSLLVPVAQGRSHSTPVKHPSETNSSSS